MSRRSDDAKRAAARDSLRGRAIVPYVAKRYQPREFGRGVVPRVIEITLSTLSCIDCQDARDPPDRSRGREIEQQAIERAQAMARAEASKKLRRLTTA